MDIQTARQRIKAMYEKNQQQISNDEDNEYLLEDEWILEDADEKLRSAQNIVNKLLKNDLTNIKYQGDNCDHSK